MSGSVAVASTGGVRVRLHRLGGDGEPLIVCHATGFHGRCYEPMARVLAEHFTVWAPDLRGHGETNAPDDGDFDWSGMGDDVLAVVDHLGVSRVRMFGHSMGGCAVLLAELARPGLLQSAYLYEPIVLGDGQVADPEANTMPAMARRRRERFGSRPEALMRYATRPGLSVLRADALAAYVNGGFVDDPAGGVVLACRREAEARTFEASGKLPVRHLTAISAPVTVALGRVGGDTGPALLAPLVAAGLRLGRLEEYDRIGHFGPLQDPDFVAARVLDAVGVVGGP